MKVLFYFSFIFFLFSCGQDVCNLPRVADSATKADSIYSQKFIPKYLDSIEGDFDGDGKKEFAILEMSKDGNRNLIASDDSAAEFKLIFRNGKIKSCDIPCCDNRLVKEGDLDGDGADEISVMNNEGNACTYFMFTYSLKNGNWKELLEPNLIPTGCEFFTDSTLQLRLFREKGKIYFLETDLNSEDWKLVKKVAVMKK